MSSKKHLELSDRIVIEDGVNRNLPVRTIAASLGKHPTTIAREIKQHRYRRKNTSCRHRCRNSTSAIRT